MMRLRNVLALITVLALESRDVVSSLDPDGSRYVFEGCPCEVVRPYRYDGCDPWVGHSKDDWRNGDDDVEDQWADHYSNSLNWYIRDQWADHYSNSLNWYVSEHDRGR